MYSKTMDKLKHDAIRCALSGMPYTKEDLNISTPEENIIFLKYLSNLANGEVYELKQDFSGASGRAVANAKNYVNSVFREYNILDPALLNIIENLKKIEDAVEEPFGYTPRDWDRYVAKVGYVASISGKQEIETMRTAIVLHLMAAEQKGQMPQALKSLTDFLYINSNSNSLLNGFKEFAGLTLEKESLLEHADTVFAPYIKKYQAVVDSYTAKIEAPVTQNEDSYYRSDLQVYRAEYERMIRMMRQIIETENINVRDRYRNSLLHIAVYEKDADFAIDIIKLGVDMDIENENNIRAIQYVTNSTWTSEENKKKQAAILEEMFKHGVNISFKCYKETYIDRLLAEAENNPMIKELLDKYVPDTNKVSALTSVFC